jgi:DNA-binding winged helix-turn-helix (wHTH) protein/TolB-like protein/Tfp pilus assembly protein PilF
MIPANSTDNTVYAFGPFSIDASERQLRRDREPVSLPPKAVDLLLALIEVPGRVRTREELLERVWPDTVVEESNLSQNIFLLRKALDDDRDRWIATVPRRGYRFAGEVQRRAETDAAPPPAAAVEPPPRSRYPRRTLIAAVVAAVVLLAAAAIVAVRYASSKSAATDRPRAIAVLPFRDVDDRHRDRALELGVADTLINKLSRLPQLIVSPTHAVSGFIDKPADARTAGRALGVEAVIEGNLQRDGNRIRSTVRMVNVADGHSEWAETYDEDISDLFTLEDRIAERATAALDLRLSRNERRGIARRYTDDREAYALYETGRLEWLSFNPKRLMTSIRYYEAALHRDPRYALAYAGLASSYDVISLYGPLPSEEASARAKENAYRALQLDPDLAQAHIALAAQAIFHDRDWAAADAELTRVQELDPNSVDVQTLRGYWLHANASAADALPHLQRARDLDPTWHIPQNDMLLEMMFLRRYGEASRLGQELLTLDPADVFATSVLTRVKLLQGDLNGARAIAEEVLRVAPHNRRMLGIMAVFEARQGRRDLALARIAAIRALGQASPAGVGEITIAYVFESMGDHDHALEALGRACDSGAPFLYQIRQDPEFDGIRRDPRYAALLARIHLRP